MAKENVRVDEFAKSVDLITATKYKLKRGVSHKNVSSADKDIYTLYPSSVVGKGFTGKMYDIGTADISYLDSKSIQQLIDSGELEEIWQNSKTDKKVQYSLSEEEVTGGLADGKTPEEIADMHGVAVEQILDQIEKGIKVELEHTDNEEMAKEIAMDHLYEIPDYYDRLAYVEAGVDESKPLPTFEQFVSQPKPDRSRIDINEDDKATMDNNKIKSEVYWKQTLKGNDYALSVLNTIMTKQDGIATDRQMGVLNRAKNGDKNYSTKN
jgi:DNA-binding CsgD family transcriptional regulator